MRWRAWITIGLALITGARAEGPPTFSLDVAPLLYAKCAACHQPGGLGPFSVVSYADARAKAGKMARMTMDAVMPPWLPMRDAFVGTKKLELAEAALLRRWAEAGAPEGDKAQLPAAPKLPADWQLGQPDLVLTVKEAFPVSSDGDMVTAHFVFPLGFTEQRALRAVEILPGNPRVVQSARVLFDRSGRARELGGKEGRYERFGGAGFFPSAEMPSQGPAQLPPSLPDGVGLMLGPETDLVLQVRYRPSGQLQTDASRVGLYFAKEKPGRVRASVFLGKEAIAVPPKSKGHVVRDEVVLPVALAVTDLRPNLLLFGTAIRAWAETPDGRKVTLLEIANWKHAWQETYRFPAPITLPKGTRIKVLWEFDNPSGATVRRGDTPLDEAPALWVNGVAGSPADQTILNKANLTHYTELRKAVKGRK